MRLPAMLFLLSVITLKDAIAQPVLTRTNTVPVPGDSMVTKRYESFPELPGGAAMVWDYATATPFSAAQQNSWYSDTAHAAYKPVTTGANLVLNTLNISSFQAITDSYWLRAGSIENRITDTIYTHCNSPDTVMVFPLGYLDSFYNSFTAVLLSDPIEFRTDADTCVADGWGTLLLPDGTAYNNVLRVKKRSTRRFEDGTGYSLNHRIICYAYYQPGFYEPLLEHYMWQYMIGSGPEAFDISHFVVRSFYSSLKVPQAGSSRVDVSIYPNPAHDKFTVTIPNGTVTITDLNGSMLYRQEVSGTATVDCHYWPAGVYMIYARLHDGSISTGRILLQ